MDDIRQHLSEIITLFDEASVAVMDVYNSFDLDTVIKDDDTPQTKADRISHQILSVGLQNIMPSVPVVSEEGSDEQSAKIVKTNTFWLLDPLDGTKEFISHNGQFVVCAGLIQDGKLIFGIAAAPALSTIYYGGSGMGSFKLEVGKDSEQIHVSSSPTNIIMGSLSNKSPATSSYIAEHFAGFELKTLGSLLKFIEIAEGKADAFPRVEHTMKLWDVAAGHAILEGAGGTVTRPDGSPIDYTNEQLLIGDFVAHS